MFKLTLAALLCFVAVSSFPQSHSLHKRQSDTTGVEAAESAVEDDLQKLEEDEAKLEDSINELETETTNSGQEVAQCVTLATCQDHADCNGGQCMGSFLGTCNCNACLNFWKCSDDSECGGLHNACNNGTGMCDCLGAHVQNGFKDSFDAFTNLCNVKSCSKDTFDSDCFGLPCNTGLCFC